MARAMPKRRGRKMRRIFKMTTRRRKNKRGRFFFGKGGGVIFLVLTEDLAEVEIKSRTRLATGTRRDEKQIAGN
jgi:hypothetical protein